MWRERYGGLELPRLAVGQVAELHFRVGVRLDLAFLDLRTIGRAGEHLHDTLSKPLLVDVLLQHRTRRFAGPKAGNICKSAEFPICAVECLCNLLGFNLNIQYYGAGVLLLLGFRHGLPLLMRDAKYAIPWTD